MNAPPAPLPPAGSLAIGYQPSGFAADTDHLHELVGSLHRDTWEFLSFPDHLGLVAGELVPLLSMFVDHRGDPHSRSSFDLATQPYEEAVLEYFAAVAGASPADVQGYVASSHHEALLHGLATARRRLPTASVYVCEQAHSSVTRACELLQLNRVAVRSLPDGTMDPVDLRVQTRVRSGAGALVVATCGTPLQGAIDSVAELRAAAAASGRVHMHVDATAGGLVAAHSDQVLSWSLAHGADSITLSGHCLLGLPGQAGIALMRRVNKPAAGSAITMPEHAVICGRGGLAALLLWMRLRSLGRAGVAALIARCQDVAVYAVDRFERVGARPKHFPGSLTVTFDRPPAWVIDKWRLDYVGNLARIVTTGPLTHRAVDELASDLSLAHREAVA
ncbi:pyridoxal-dependent decarboxylase [Streptomyces lydicus]|uniref:pyridoxal-dependent decarboxylase n=1 Tax=Streptomyces lydicus TaxID=47763 RepID=UPI0034061FDA